MRCLNRIGMVTGVLLSVAGCKSSASAPADGATGAGGQTGVDGAADRPATGGAGAGGSAARDGAQDVQAEGGCLGVCLETLFAQCSKVGQTCTTATLSSGEVVDCYANGVKQAKVAGASSTTTVVQTSGAQTCYESDLTGTVETIKNLDEKTIAQITHTSTTQLSIDCYGADGSVTTTNVDLTSAACAPYYASTTQACTAGTCTF